jgi:hypothetical protein
MSLDAMATQRHVTSTASGGRLNTYFALRCLPWDVMVSLLQLLCMLLHLQVVVESLSGCTFPHSINHEQLHKPAWFHARVVQQWLSSVNPAAAAAVGLAAGSTGAVHSTSNATAQAGSPLQYIAGTMDLSTTSAASAWQPSGLAAAPEACSHSSSGYPCSHSALLAASPLGAPHTALHASHCCAMC